MFGEEPEFIPDPNKPENTAFLNAKKKQQREQIRQFVNGHGKVLFERWKKQIQVSTMALFGMASSDCNCPLCWEVRKIKNIFELILEAESVLREQK